MNTPATHLPAGTAEPGASEAFERRFGGLRRLYGIEAAQRVFDAHAVVIGIGGVGSWAAEAFARSGVSHLTLVDMDHVGESNTNRQIHALQGTLGQAKVLAMRDRIAQINPWAQVDVVDDFVTPENWQGLADAIAAQGRVPMVLDACDQMATKVAMAAWALDSGALFMAAGAAGGKRFGHLVEVADLVDTTHDPLLAQLRYRLRKHHGVSRDGSIGLNCVFSREAVSSPDAECVAAGQGDGSLNCHGYGSSVGVTATFGMCAAGWLMERLASGRTSLKKKSRQFKRAKN
ncbi:tRNA threonylcarbamoyladenosine dehydratase [Hydrogenophaga aquatica]